MKPSTPLLALAVVTLSLGASAAQAQMMKPGLWETTSKMQAANGEMASAMAMMQKQMANMSPEQRKAMEAMMAKQGSGISMPTVTDDGAIITKTCMTKEMIDKSQLLTQQTQRGNCTQKNTPMEGGVIKTTFSCTNPPAKGEARIVIKSDTSYNMTMNSTATVNGKQESMAFDASGKWLGADCGKVKPRTMPPAMQPK